MGQSIAMGDTGSIPPAKPIKPVLRLWQWALLGVMPLLAGGTLWAGLWQWHRWTAWERPKGTERPAADLVLHIATLGVAAALALAVVIWLLNQMRANPTCCRWYVRMPVSLLKRVLLILQIAAMAGALYAVGTYYMPIKVWGL